MTQEKIFNIFEAFVSQHGQLKDFGVGSYFKIDTKEDRRYPLMWITPKPDNFKPQEDRFTFDIMIADILDSNETNLRQVWSDCEQIGQDFIRYFGTTYGYQSDEYYWLRLDTNYHKEPFMHLLGNEAAGYFYRLTFITTEDTSYCENPTV